MTLTRTVMGEFFEVTACNDIRLIRMPQRFSTSKRGGRKPSTIGWWTAEEHDKFLEAMEKYPSGPWKKIARHIGTRTSRQVMTHAQKYRQRIKRQAERKTSKTKSDKSSPGKIPLCFTPNGALSIGIDANEETTVELPPLDFDRLELSLDPALDAVQVADFEDVPTFDEFMLLDELSQLDCMATEQMQKNQQAGYGVDDDELMALLFDYSIDPISSLPASEDYRLCF